MTLTTLGKAFVRIVFVTLGSPVLLVFGILYGIAALGDWAFSPPPYKGPRGHS